MCRQAAHPGQKPRVLSHISVVADEMRYNARSHNCGASCGAPFEEASGLSPRNDVHAPSMAVQALRWRGCRLRLGTPEASRISAPTDDASSAQTTASEC